MIKGWPEKKSKELITSDGQYGWEKCHDLCTKALEQAEESKEGLADFLDSSLCKSNKEWKADCYKLSNAILKEYIVIKRDKVKEGL